MNVIILRAMSFKNKSAFYKSIGKNGENLKENSFVNVPKHWKDSQDWKKTTQEMIEIQKVERNWFGSPVNMSIAFGNVLTACDHFSNKKDYKLPRDTRKRKIWRRRHEL